MRLITIFCLSFFALLFSLSVALAQVPGEGVIPENDSTTININNQQGLPFIPGKDQLPEPPDSLTGDTNFLLADSLVADSILNDTLAADSLEPAGDIKYVVTYNAADSIRMDVVTQKVYLYGNAKITYGDIELEADKIEFSWLNNTLVARGTPNDSNDLIKGMPHFKQGSDEYNAEVIKYNFKTQKGIISNVVMQEGQGFLHGKVIKRNSNGNLYVQDAEYTTCNLAHPHFGIKATKIKAVPGKKIITGPFYLSVADVPTPLAFFMGMFPTPKRQSSGVIIPSYGESADRGFFLRNGGFYLALGDYAGVRATGELYSKGSWGAALATDYRKRYQYGGAASLRFNKRLNGDEGFEAVAQDYWFDWRHAPESKGNAGRFAANVGLGSSQFNQRNSFNPTQYISPTFNSAVTYSKSFQGTPFTMSVAARQSQDVNEVMNVTLPQATFGMNSIYPFRKEGEPTKSWYQNTSVSYQMNTAYQITNNGLSELIVARSYHS